LLHLVGYLCRTKMMHGRTNIKFLYLYLHFQLSYIFSSHLLNC